MLLAWLLQLVELLLVRQIQGEGPGPQVGLALAATALLSLVMLVRIGLYIVMVAVIVQVVLSWIGPRGPAMLLLNSMTRPFLRVFQRRIPPVGNVDLSPLFAIVVIQLLLMLPVAWLEYAVASLF